MRPSGHLAQPPLPPPNPYIRPGPESLFVLRSLGGAPGLRGAEDLKAELRPGAGSDLRLAVMAAPRLSR